MSDDWAIAKKFMQNMHFGAKHELFGRGALEVWLHTDDMRSFWNHVVAFSRLTVCTYGIHRIFYLALKNTRPYEMVRHLEIALVNGEWSDVVALCACGISLPYDLFNQYLMVGILQTETKIRMLTEASLTVFQDSPSATVVADFLNRMVQEATDLLASVRSALCMLNSPQYGDVASTTADHKDKEQMFLKAKKEAEQLLSNIRYMGVEMLRNRIVWASLPPLKDLDE